MFRSDLGGLLIFLLPYTVCVVGPDVAKVFKSSRRYHSKSTFTKNTNISHLNPTSVWVEIPHCKEMAGRRKRSKSKRIFKRRKPKSLKLPKKCVAWAGLGWAGLGWGVSVCVCVCSEGVGRGG